MNNLLIENPNWENIRNIVYSICFDEQLKKCKNCGKEMKHSQGNNNYCSLKCAGNSIEIRNKVKQTNLERYNVENPFQSKKIKDKIKQTNLEKYGHEYWFQSEEFKNKSKQTCMKNYNVEHSMQSKEVQEKTKQTWINNYRY